MDEMNKQQNIPQDNPSSNGNMTSAISKLIHKFISLPVKTKVIAIATAVAVLGGSVTTIALVSSNGDDSYKDDNKVSNVDDSDNNSNSNGNNDDSGIDDEDSNKPEKMEYSDGLKFTSNGDGTCGVSGLGICEDTDLNIPPISPDGEVVISINEEAFFWEDHITSVIIPSSVKNIDVSAFENCYSLSSITIPEGVESIGEYALKSCGITNIVIPNSVTSIASSILAECTRLESITIPFVGVKYGDTEEAKFYKLFGGHADYVPKSLKTVIVNGGEVIPEEAFYMCKTIKKVIIGEGVTTIEQKAFSGCYDLLFVTIGDNVTTIENYAFNMCDSIKSLEIGKNVSNIAPKAFNSSNGIVEIINESSLSITKYSEEYKRMTEDALEIHSGRSKIVDLDGYLFYSCDNTDYLIGYIGDETDLVLPGSYNGRQYVINKGAFKKYGEIKSIKFSTGVKACYEDAFGSSSSGIKVKVDDIAIWCNIDFANFMANPLWCQNNKLYVNDVLVTDIVIPNGVSHIRDYAFCFCNQIKSVEFSSDVKSVGASAFEKCNSLEKVIIKDVGSWCGIDFSNTSSNPLSIAQKLYIGSVLATDIVVPEGVTKLNDYTFMNCKDIINIDIPASVISIGNYTFYGCEKLSEMVLPSNVIEIGEYAFYQCFSMSEIELPVGLKTVGAHAFDSCTSIANMLLPDGVEIIGNSAFRNCVSLLELKMPSSVVEIGECILYECNKIQSITTPFIGNKQNESQNCNIGFWFGVDEFDQLYDMPSSLVAVTITNATEIGDYAFYMCTSIKKVIICSGISRIGKSGLLGCYANILFTGTEEEWKKIAVDSGNNLTHNYIVYNYVPE